jgi:glycosyltransferase involved in cell wall biosynthesis
MLYLAHGLERRGHRVVIFTTALDFDKLPEFARHLTYVVRHEHILEPGGELSNFRSIESPATLFVRLLRLRRDLRRLVREHDIDVVNPHNPPANWITSFLGVPTVWSCHNNPISFYANLRAGYTPLWPEKTSWRHRVGEACYELVDFALMRYGMGHIVALSERIARELGSVYRRRSEIITFVPSSEDGTCRTANSQSAKFAALDGGPLVLIQVGQLNEFKRPMFSVDVLDAVRRRIPAVRLVFAGDGAQRADLEREVARRGLDAHTSFAGMCDEETLAELYGGAHVLLFPGLNQPLGIVPFEAVWNSVVPLVVDSSGVAPIMERLGPLTVAAPTVAAFTDRIVSIYERRSDMDTWLARAQRTLAEELSFDGFLDKYEQCFRRCVEQPGAAKDLAK